MDSPTELSQDRLKSFFTQLQVEYGILDRLIYKNKNQHRRCLYFRHLLKVWRDLKLLQSAHLGDVMNSCFIVINGNKPSQKVHLLESLKTKKCDVGKYNFMERLLGGARLLSQMVEPMLKASTELSILLAQSFFMGFSVTLLAVLARVRVLVQQILVDSVSVFNMVSSISQKEQSVRLSKERVEVFRQYYPRNQEAVVLECVWERDKFVLHERLDKKKIESEDENLEGSRFLRKTNITYKIMQTFLGDVEEEGTSEEKESLKSDDDSSNAEMKINVNSDAQMSCSNPLKRKTTEVAYISIKSGVQINN